MNTRLPTAVSLLLALGSSPLLANTQSHQGWQSEAQAGWIHERDSGLEQDGELGVDRFFAQFETRKALDEKLQLGLSVGLGRADYDFSGSQGFAAARPWDKVDEFRLGLSSRYRMNERWTLFALPALRFNAESGASLGDGMTAGLLGGASYRLSDSLSIGPGFGVFSEIEDSASFFPVLLIDWQITDSLSLETGRGYAASRGPGLQLNWRHSSQWRYAFGARYEKQRFRLDDDGVAADGFGEKSSIPLYALAEYRVTPKFRVQLIGGAELDGELNLEDDDGGRLDSTDLDTAPFFGLNLGLQF
jgi:hypothetical protein